MKTNPFKRDFVNTLEIRLKEPRRFMQALHGPRQVGKTTGALQAMAKLHHCLYFNADELSAPHREWVLGHWEQARRLAREHGQATLILDEIQRVPQWTSVVKFCWDQDTQSGCPLKVVLLGSSAMLMMKGLHESMAGRFELIPVNHWSYPEMRDAFGWGLKQYLLQGGYPSIADLAGDATRWKSLVSQALIEPAISRDVLAMSRVERPALLRQLFVTACQHAAEVVSYTRILGQLSDQGNTTILAHYQLLLEQAGLLLGLPKWSGGRLQKRASSPKWLPLAPALITGASDLALAEWDHRPEWQGRLLEAAIGTHLATQCRQEGHSLYYWRDGNDEVDYVVSAGSQLLAIEVKSGTNWKRAPGLSAFAKRWPKAKLLLIGGQGESPEEFLARPLKHWL